MQQNTEPKIDSHKYIQQVVNKCAKAMEKEQTIGKEKNYTIVLKLLDVPLQKMKFNRSHLIKINKNISRS